MRRLLNMLLVPGFLWLGCLGTQVALSQAAGPSGPTPRFIVIHHDVSETQLQYAGNLPTFTSSFTYKGKTYSYTMVGADPARGSATTTVPVTIIPIRFVIGKSTFDGSSRIDDTTQSPLFHKADFGNQLGNTQYLDAFRRAEFYEYTGKTSRNYHVLLGTPTIAGPLTLNVPAHAGSVAVDAYTGKTIGLVNIYWLDRQLRSQLSHYSPNMVPVFLSYNSYATLGAPTLTNCCIGGNHSAVGSGPGAQTYVWTTDTDQGIQGGFGNDINATSHELGEVLDNPFVKNTVPHWYSPLAPQYGCNNALEVGDPLVMVNITIAGYPQYHAQDLAFFSWFAKQKPSIGYNGRYDFSKQFTTYGSVC